MTIAEVSKAVGAAAAGASGAPALLYAATLAIPAGVTAPWWAYPAVGLVQAAWNYGITWRAPRNADGAAGG